MNNVNDGLSKSQLIRRDFSVTAALMSEEQRGVVSDVMQMRSWQMQNKDGLHGVEVQLTVIAEEVGEAARAILDGRAEKWVPANYKKLYQECIDVAASAMALAEMALRLKETADGTG